MSAVVTILPVRPASFHLDDAAWREQYARECAALCEALREPPPRTRPIAMPRKD